ncbi:MAG: phosphodiester glycosidase family protein [Butyrivibrio sp.]|nr:phosphodiester glycosidase family protein [Butyrivibrio sp.]
MNSSLFGEETVNTLSEADATVTLNGETTTITNDTEESDDEESDNAENEDTKVKDNDEEDSDDTDDNNDEADPDSSKDSESHGPGSAKKSGKHGKPGSSSDSESSGSSKPGAKKGDTSNSDTTAQADSSENKTTTDSSDNKTETGSSDSDSSSQTESLDDESTSASTSSELTSGSVIGTYDNEDARITITEYTYEDTQVYVADVTLSSVEYIKTAFADDSYGKNVTETVSSMASDNNAVLAINGDNYGSQESGYVIRNGIIYRDEAGTNDVLCIYADGSMEVVSPDEYTAQELIDKGVWQAFSFGPSLIEEGTVTVSEDDEVGKARASNPRTAIGIVDDLHYLIVVSDGRTDESEGLSLYQLAEFMDSLGATTAYNLDGGGSSTMVFNGTLINNPTTTGNSIKEREVNDIVYIG